MSQTPKPTGGPAFPVPNLQHDADFNGMTLRDYFAAKAMQELLSQEDYTSFEHVARAAYMQADAMLAAREAA